MQFKKALLTAGAVGVLGTAGTFGTFAAFTASESTPLTVEAGTVKIKNTIDFTKLATLGTADKSNGPSDDTAQYDLTATPKQQGSITVENTGTQPQDIYIDFDGPGVQDMVDPYKGSSNLLAENIKVDSSFDPNFGQLLDNGTRLWQLNRRGLSQYFAAVPKGESRTLYFRFWLRERRVDLFPTGDNAMQGLKLDNQNVTVKAVEAGHDDLAPTATPNYDFGS